MQNSKRRYIFIAIILLGLSYILWDALSESGIKDLRGDFKEVAFKRNEQNTGPVVRIYAVTVADTLWTEMEKYGNFMPHTKYGTTRVYFFLKNNAAPAQISLEGDNINSTDKKNCIARYEKNTMGQVYLSKYPF
jgi:hypothetical protein